MTRERVYWTTCYNNVKCSLSRTNSLIIAMSFIENAVLLDASKHVRRMFSNSLRLASEKIVHTYYTFFRRTACNRTTWKYNLFIRCCQRQLVLYALTSVHRNHDEIAFESSRISYRVQEAVGNRIAAYPSGCCLALRCIGSPRGSPRSRPVWWTPTRRRPAGRRPLPPRPLRFPLRSAVSCLDAAVSLAKCPTGSPETRQQRKPTAATTNRPTLHERARPA